MNEKLCENRDIVVTMNHPPEGYSLEFIEGVQAGIDKVLVGLGFARSNLTEVGEKTSWSYYQFGECQHNFGANHVCQFCGKMEWQVPKND